MAVDVVARAMAAGKVPVTAYEYAVQAGYTGTEEQFAEDMGNSGTNATNAANSATAAAASATTAANAAGNLAPAYSASATYAVGDHVLYDGGYYVCNTAITTAEAWTAAHWTAAKVGPEITDLKTQLDNVITVSQDVVPVEVSNVENVTKLSGCNSAPRSSSPIGIEISVLNTMDTYWWVADKDCDIYFANSEYLPAYVSITVASGFIETETSGSSIFLKCASAGTRYRKSDSNLPTENSKLTLHTGDAIAVTITATKNVTLYGYKTTETIAPNEDFKNEILAGVADKHCQIKYISGAGSEKSTERVEIYIPTVDGFVRYDFLHSESSSNPYNADIWHIGYAYHITESMIEDYALTTQGEWECAIKLSGENFAGGFAHGNEVFTNIIFLVDGVAKDITQITTPTDFEELIIIQNSNYYDPSDGTTVFAAHGMEYIFNESGVTINQSVGFSVASTVETMYMAMFPVAKAVSDTVVPNNTFVPFSTSNAIRIFDTDSVTIYKSTGKCVATFSAPVWELLNNGYSFLCLDNGSTEYNKCYFVNTLVDVSVAQNKLLKSVTKYNFIVGN